MRDETERLRACPTCGAEDRDMGLRDYIWLEDILPGRAGGTDIDCLIDQEYADRDLVLEFKPSKWVNRGQARLFNRMVPKGFDVWVIVDKNLANDELLMGVWSPSANNNQGGVVSWHQLTLHELRVAVANWWNLGTG